MPEDSAQNGSRYRVFSEEIRAAAGEPPTGSEYTRLNLSADEDMLDVELKRIAALFAKRTARQR